MGRPGLALAVLFVAGCSSNDPTARPEAGVREAAARDTRAEVFGPDLGPDAFAALTGVGELTGACGVLDDALWAAADEPALFRNLLDFGSSYAFDISELSAGGQKIHADGNLGGSSLHSEIFAFEVLRRCELAQLLKTEGEVTYDDPSGKKTDLLVRIDGRKIGVSVTRAVGYPPEDPYSMQQAQERLDKKLGDLPVSAANAAAGDR